MPYDDSVAERVRRVLRRRKNIAGRKMFGGIAFILVGNMCCGVLGKNLVLRLGKDGAAAALDEPQTRPMDFTGKPLKTMVYVSAEGFKHDDDLKAWIKRAIDFTKTLPAK